MAKYKPSLDWGLPNPHAADEGHDDRAGKAWEDAPATSHIHSWRYYDVRDHKFLAKFPGSLGRGRSELHVRFKQKDGGPTASYTYFYSDPGAGLVILDKLRGSPHPYGEVLKPLVIDAGVEYTRS